VNYRPALLLAILVYVTLDLSLPAMPGAFVFDSSDSVEGTHIRARAAVEIVALPAPGHDTFAVSRPPVDVKIRLTPAAPLQPGRRPDLGWRSRVLHDPAPPSEDPH
jgi:hypothetical protein